jgi:dTDP-4-dehydrorhamnose reductase
MLRLGAKRDELNVVADQADAPAWSTPISVMISSVLSQALRGEQDWWMQYSGVYHLSASGATSWCAFAQTFSNARSSTTNLR